MVLRRDVSAPEFHCEVGQPDTSDATEGRFGSHVVTGFVEELQVKTAGHVLEVSVLAAIFAAVERSERRRLAAFALVDAGWGPG